MKTSSLVLHHRNTACEASLSYIIQQFAPQVELITKLLVHKEKFILLEQWRTEQWPLHYELNHWKHTYLNLFHNNLQLKASNLSLVLHVYQLLGPTNLMNHVQLIFSRVVSVRCPFKNKLYQINSLLLLKFVILLEEIVMQMHVFRQILNRN